METKVVVSIARSDATIAAFADLTTLDKSLSAKLADIAVDLAEQVKDLDLPVSSKSNLVEATYSKEFGELAKQNRNTVQLLRALVLAKCAGKCLVEVSPPSKDGKTAAVFKTAATLSPTQAKTFAADIKAIVAEAEETPSQKVDRENKAKIAEREAQAAKDTAATAAAMQKGEEAFAFCLSDEQRPVLTARLAKIGLALIKAKGAPAKG